VSNFKPDRLSVVSIYAQDIPTTAHFYMDVIGLPLLHDHHDPVALDTGGTFLVILRGDPPRSPDPDHSGFPLLTFAVDDLDEAVRHLQDHQVEIVDGIREKNGTRWVLFQDPAGNLLEFARFGG
jgi:glyoxylase I family protein